MAANSFTPAGQTFLLTPGGTSTSTVVTAAVPVRSLLLVNSHSKPIAFTVGINTSTATAVVPTAGNPQNVIVVNNGSSFVIDVPVRYASAVAGLGGFTTTVIVACIEAASGGTGNVYVTPVL